MAAHWLHKPKALGSIPGSRNQILKLWGIDESEGKIVVTIDYSLVFMKLKHLPLQLQP